MPDIAERRGETYDSDGSEGESDLTSLADDEFPQHFSERDNRLFHSHGSSPYPLPADTPEQHRLKKLHDIVKLLMDGQNHFGLASEALQLVSGIRRRALDLCTGKGIWVLEMAAEFPHVKFYGVDIVPIMSRYPPPNVQFEIHDVTTPLRYFPGYFDLVHFRHAQLAIPRPQRLVAEIARVLRPGGIFLSGDWESDFQMQDGSNPETAAPGAYDYFIKFNQIMMDKGICVKPIIYEHLESNDNFTDIVRFEYKVIMNLDQGVYLNAIGSLMQDVFTGFVDSSEDAFLNFGAYTKAEFATIKARLKWDLYNVPGLTFIYRAVRARKIDTIIGI